MSTSNFENFENIVSDQRSRNAQASSYGFFIYYIFYKISHSRRLLILKLFVLVLFLDLLFFQSSMFCQPFNQVCVAFNLFLFFAFSQVAQRCFGLTKQTNCPPFFHLVFKIWCLPAFPRQLLYCNLLMYSSLFNQKVGNLRSI